MREATTIRLTAREGQVLTLLRDGLERRQIAAVMGLGVGTVSHHITSLMRKAGAKNAVNLVIRLHRLVLKPSVLVSPERGVVPSAGRRAGRRLGIIKSLAGDRAIVAFASKNGAQEEVAIRLRPCSARTGYYPGDFVHCERSVATFAINFDAGEAERLLASSSYGQDMGRPIDVLVADIPRRLRRRMAD